MPLFCPMYKTREKKKDKKYKRINHFLYSWWNFHECVTAWFAHLLFRLKKTKQHKIVNEIFFLLQVKVPSKCSNESHTAPQYNDIITVWLKLLTVIAWYIKYDVCCDWWRLSKRAIKWKNCNFTILISH